MAGGELPVRHQLLEGRGEVQKPHGVGHGAAGLAHPPGRLLLGHAVVGNQGPEALGLLHGVQVLPLEVLDHSQLHGLLVVRLDHHSGDLRQLRHPGGPPPPLSGDDLIVAGGELPHRQGLDDPVLPDGVRQLLQLLLIEALPGLGPAALDLGQGNGGGGGGEVGGEVVSQQSAQPLAHAFFL